MTTALRVAAPPFLSIFTNSHHVKEIPKLSLPSGGSWFWHSSGREQEGPWEDVATTLRSCYCQNSLHCLQVPTKTIPTILPKPTTLPVMAAPSAGATDEQGHTTAFFVHQPCRQTGHLTNRSSCFSMSGDDILVHRPAPSLCRVTQQATG